MFRRPDAFFVYCSLYSSSEVTSPMYVFFFLKFSILKEFLHDLSYTLVISIHNCIYLEDTLYNGDNYILK